VLAAGDPHRKETLPALASLSENYWCPLYAYLRRRGYPADQAQDLTQPKANSHVGGHARLAVDET
jgi:hypothetical protein